MKADLAGFLGVSFFVAVPTLGLPQSNQIPGTEVSLGSLAVGTDVMYWGRKGSFPDGTAAFSISTTACNLGTVDVPWLAPMQENHPFIAFLFARESGGRMVQISDRSFVKHGFFALSNSQCTPCLHPSDGTFLGVGCSDTYSVTNNGDRNYLAPPDEVDPWLGTWNRFCSYFDSGDPPVPPPADCDGVRSLNTAGFDAVKNRVQVLDADLDVAGATYYYQGYYVIRGEPEGVRGNNAASREFRPTWNGTSWLIDTTSFSNPHTFGSVLGRWSGASLGSSTNGEDDGRVYVAVKVTGPDAMGSYHYEYAVHNRDNDRGLAAFRIPVCPTVAVSGVGFRDIDQKPDNDWIYSKTATEILFSTTTSPLRWNMIFNFWFDTKGRPVAGATAVDQFDPGPGQTTFTISSVVPIGCPLIMRFLGPLFPVGPVPCLPPTCP